MIKLKQILKEVHTDGGAAQIYSTKIIDGWHVTIYENKSFKYRVQVVNKNNTKGFRFFIDKNGKLLDFEAVIKKHQISKKIQDAIIDSISNYTNQ